MNKVWSNNVWKIKSLQYQVAKIERLENRKFDVREKFFYILMIVNLAKISAGNPFYSVFQFLMVACYKNQGFPEFYKNQVKSKTF